MGVKSDYRNLLGTCRGGQFAQIIVFFKKDHPYWTQNSFYQPQGWSTCTSGPGGGGAGGKVTFSFLGISGHHVNPVGLSFGFGLG